MVGKNYLFLEENNVVNMSCDQFKQKIRYIMIIKICHRYIDKKANNVTFYDFKYIFEDCKRNILYNRNDIHIEKREIL